MIWALPEVSIALAYGASTAAIVKSALTTLAVLLALLIGFLWARLSERDACAMQSILVWRHIGMRTRMTVSALAKQ